MAKKLVQAIQPGDRAERFHQKQVTYTDDNNEDLEMHDVHLVVLSYPHSTIPRVFDDTHARRKL